MRGGERERSEEPVNVGYRIRPVEDFVQLLVEGAWTEPRRPVLRNARQINIRVFGNTLGRWPLPANGAGFSVAIGKERAARRLTVLRNRIPKTRREIFGELRTTRQPLAGLTPGEPLRRRPAA